jgi:two-component system, LuxR family, sensor kinase FixL
MNARVQTRPAFGTLFRVRGSDEPMPTSLVNAEVLHEALRQAPAILYVTEADLRILYVNRVAHGYEMEDIIGTYCGARLPPEQQRKLWSAVERLQATGQPQYIEVFIDPPSGERQYYSNRLSVFETPDGATRGMLSMLTEITRERVAELRMESLRSERNEASHRIGMAEVATGVLHDVAKALRSAELAAQGLTRQLAGWRVHQLGPIAALLADDADRRTELPGAGRSEREPAARLAELALTLAEERGHWQDELSRLRDCVALMRSLVQTQHGLTMDDGAAEPTVPDELFDRALSLFELELETRGIRVVRELADVGSVMLDRQATLQVLANLIRNAIEALELVDRPRELVLRAYADGEKLRFEVQDNGGGIAREHIGELFRYGFSTKPNGHGFGLHTSAIAARMMRGTLEGFSAGPGHGARMRLTLPRVTGMNR